MFWLMLFVYGDVNQGWGPLTRAECHARRVVMMIDRPRGHEYRCVRRA